MTPAPASAPVLATLKDFQRATAEQAFRRLWTDQDRVKKFLVADEVGLGKTMVAKGVIAKTIEHLWNEVERIDIVYICSNNQIARQNLSRLNTGGHSLAHADRLTLLPTEIGHLDGHRVNYIAFTPGTSFDVHQAGGRWEERRLLYWMLARVWGRAEVRPTRWMRFFEGGMNQANFASRLKGLDPDKIHDAVVEAFDTGLHTATGRHGAPLVDELAACVSEFNYLRGKPTTELSSRRYDLIGRLRGLLAHASITALEPDLVIMDEFQRFKHLLTPGEEANPAAELAEAIFDHPDARTLMLSATPYKMYTLPDDPEGDDHYADFTKTVRFLTGDNRAASVEKHLRIMRESLVAGGDMPRAIEAKEAAQDELRRVMCRTERLAATPDRDGMLVEKSLDQVRLTPGDVRGWRTLDRVAEAVGSHDVFEYWRSTPYPLNIMDRGSYLIRRGLDAAVARQDPALTAVLKEGRGLLSGSDLQSYAPIDPGNAKMRGLMADVLDSGSWRLLWLPPSLPYYGLGGSYAAPELRRFTKRLVFSAWNVVPKAISVVLSYEAERRAVAQAGGSSKAYADRVPTRPLDYKAAADGRPGRMSTLAVTYPSTVLAAAGDTWRVGQELGELPADPAHVFEAVRRRIDELLVALPEHAAGDDPRASQRWYWAAPLLLDRAHDVKQQARLESILRARGRASDAEALRAHLDAFLDIDIASLGPRPADLSEVLALIAIASPANTALRSLARVGGGDMVLTSAHVRDEAASIAGGFRGLFNKPEAVTILHGDEGDEHYWRTVLQHCHDGCLQAVLDEYAHVIIESEGLQDVHGHERTTRVAEVVLEAMGIKTVSNTIDDLSVDLDGNIVSRTHRIRLDLAARFGNALADDKTEVREASVRTAYNSPFRPFVLASTSVGQEGLDFHTYSHAIVHWNLPGNPVDLEQREGRVHRYKGHAVRKNLATQHINTALSTTSSDPWEAMFEAAAATRAADDSEIVPYWVLPGDAAIERYVPTMPLSREEQHYRRLKRTVGAYRMVIGQPRQDDLLSYLNDSDLSPADIAMDLTPPRLAGTAKPALVAAPTLARVGEQGSWVERHQSLWRTADSDGLVRLVDLDLDGGPSHPNLFEYAAFKGDRWDKVPRMRDLFARLAEELWTIDADLFKSRPHGYFIQTERDPDLLTVRLRDGRYLYVGWWQAFLLIAAKDFVTAYGLDDDVKVKLRSE